MPNKSFFKRDFRMFLGNCENNYNVFRVFENFFVCVCGVKEKDPWKLLKFNLNVYYCNNTQKVSLNVIQTMKRKT